VHDPSKNSPKEVTVKSLYRGLVTDFVALKAREHSKQVRLTSRARGMAIPNAPLRVPKKRFMKQAERLALGIKPRKRALDQKTQGKQAKRAKTPPSQGLEGKKESTTTPPRKKVEADTASSTKTAPSQGLEGKKESPTTPPKKR
jgi:hypothetical protein